MKGQRVGYVRVSSADQNPERQLADINLDRHFIDTASGRDTERPQLQQLLAYVREGDTVVVHSMDRLARNLGDLRTLVDDMTSRGVRIEFIKENLSFTREASALAQLMLNMTGAFAEFERAIIRERQREGIAIAKAKGVYKGRQRALTDEQVVQLRQRTASGEKKASLARELGISRETLHRYLRDTAAPAAKRIIA